MPRILTSLRDKIFLMKFLAGYAVATFVATSGRTRPTTMKATHLIAAAFAASVGFTSAFAGGEGWTHDFAAAKKQAGEEKKDLLVDFTGSDWCGWCIKLNDEVFKHEPFKTGVKDKFVLVELDYPQDKSKLSEETIKQNDELQKKYAIQGFPTILLLDAEGKPFARTGYQEGGPEKYVAHLDELRAKKGERDKAFADAAKAEGPAKAKALISALTAMELEDPVVATFYPDVVEQIKAADPKDETGFAKGLAEKEKFSKWEAGIQEFAEKQDMEGALAYVEKSLGDFTGESKQKILATKAGILAQSGKFDDSLKALDEAVAAAPDSEIAPQLAGFKERIEQAKEEAGKEPKEEAETEEKAGE